MSKKTKAAAAEKADEGGRVALRHVTTDESKGRAEVAEAKPGPWNRGPQIGESQIRDDAYLSTYASPAELAAFRAAVAARREQVTKSAWRVLPDGTRISGDRVLAVCGKCGVHIWVKADQTTNPCPSCNMMQRLSGGQLRPVSPDEEKAWLESETAKYLKWKAEAPARAAEERQLDRLRMKLGVK